jgi:hypothetical protein
MSKLSNPTIAALVQAGQNLRGSDLKTMIQAADLWDYSPDKEGIAEENKAELIRSRFLRAPAEAKDGDASAHRVMLAFATQLGQQTVKYPGYAPPWFSELRDALLADGYEISWDGDTPRDVPLTGDAQGAIRGSIRYSILPTDAAPVPPGTGDQRPGGRTVRARLHKRPEPLPAGRRRVH